MSLQRSLLRSRHSTNRPSRFNAPTVWKILQNDSWDAQWIERTLDQLLDHACVPEGLALFKTLCRHYWTLDPRATASYINAYREMWDSDDKDETEVEI